MLGNIELKVATCDDPLVPEDVHHKSIVISLSFVSLESLHVNPRLKYFYESGDYDNIILTLN